MNDAKFIIQVCKGLIRHAHARRMLMFYSVLAAVVMLFAGATFLWGFLRDHPFIFLGYWAACAWITVLVVLLALYDLVKVRAEARRALREMERKHFAEGNDEPHDPDPR